MWQSKYEGSEEPLEYLTSLMTRSIAITSWLQRAESGDLLKDTVDISELFHPETFLNALRQQTAR